MKKKEKAERKTKATHTFDEAMQMDSGDIHRSARNYRALRVCISNLGLLQ
jgi:hypothetical protein